MTGINHFQIMDNDNDICDESFESVKEEVNYESSIDSDAEHLQTDRDESSDERILQSSC